MKTIKYLLVALIAIILLSVVFNMVQVYVNYASNLHNNLQTHEDANKTAIDMLHGK